MSAVLPYLAVLYLALLGLYSLGMGRVSARISPAEQRRRLALFMLGLATSLAVFLPSPDLFGPRYRFSVSMSQMLLAVNLAPLLVLLGLPPALLGPLSRSAALRRLAARPLPAWIISTAVFFAWFVPAFFQAASGSWPLWIFKELTMLLSGFLFWWPVAAPVAEWHPSYPARIFYLIAARFPMALLGAIFTLSNRLFYNSRSFALEICAPASITDQQLGGLIMWVVGGMVLFIAFAITFLRWFRENERAGSSPPLL